MTPKWKSIAPLAILIVLAVVFVAYSQIRTTSVYVPAPSGAQQAEQAAQMPQASGKVSDLSASLLGDVNQEESTLSDLDGDAALYTSDSQEVINLSEAYAESQF